MQVVYLHGFASSAASSKAAFFAGKLAGRGVPVVVPDFNEPDFSTLTITRMIEQTGRAIEAAGDDRLALIGSSLGGFVAVQAALGHPDRVHRLVLLAPALEFSGDRVQTLGDRTVEEWRRTNRLEVFHYGYGRTMPLRFDLYADACGYDCLAARLTIPIQIFQGRRDTAVDPDTVARWAAARPHVELHMLDDDHQLIASLDRIWPDVQRFLRI